MHEKVAAEEQSEQGIAGHSAYGEIEHEDGKQGNNYNYGYKPHQAGNSRETL